MTELNVTVTEVTDKCNISAAHLNKVGRSLGDGDGLTLVPFGMISCRCSVRIWCDLSSPSWSIDSITSVYRARLLVCAWKTTLPDAAMLQEVQWPGNQCRDSTSSWLLGH